MGRMMAWRLLVVVGVVGLLGFAGGVRVPGVWRHDGECHGASLVGGRIVEDGIDGMGWSVAVSRDARRVAVSSLGEVGESTFVSVYEQLESGEWVQMGEDLMGESTEGITVWNLPVAMSADGTEVAFGVARVGRADWMGSVVAYRWDDDDGGWMQLGQKIESDIDLIGGSLDMSADGRRIAVGVPFQMGDLRGLARVYELNDDGGEWIQLGNGLVGENEIDFFGKFVSLSADGNRVAVASTANADNGEFAGHVRVFQLSEDLAQWEQIGMDVDGEAVDDLSGRCKLSSDGSRLAVGAIWNDSESGRNAGHVKVYEMKESSGMWEQIGEDIDGDAEKDWLGWSLGLSGDGQRVVIAAPGYDDGETKNAGHVQVHDLVAAEDGRNSSWVMSGDPLRGEEGKIHFGRSVAITEDGTRFAISTLGTDGSVFIQSEDQDESAPNPQSGSVGVYEMARCNLPGGESESETEMELESESETEAEMESASETPTGSEVETFPETPAPDQPTTAPTSAPGDDGGGVCFPGEATVRMHDGSVKRMEQLVVGDRVLVADGVFSDVFAFGHREPEAVSTFVRLETAGGAVLKLSPSHYLPTADGALKTARELRVGDDVRRGDGRQERVVAVSVEQSRGLYNPHTLQGSIVVNDVLASTYTESVHPRIAHVLLAIPRALYRVGMKDPLGSLLYKSLPASLRELAPRGPSLLSG